MAEKFDAVVVGAGPAGATAALVLAQAGLKVALVERGETPGAKNMFGGALYYSEVLHKLVPDFWHEAPVERYITRRIITFLTPTASLAFDFKDTDFGHPPYNGFTLLRAKFDRWYAQKAQQAGALLIPETVVDDLLWADGKVVGIKTRRDEGELYADVVIVADGANSLLAEKAGLRNKMSPVDFAIAAKELLALPRRTIEERFNLSADEGVANEFVGSCTQGIQGGAFLYTNKASISIGIVANLNRLQKSKISIAELLDSFKEHPVLKELLKGATIKEYSGHLLPEGGLKAMPKLYGDGILLAGDAAGLVYSTGLVLEGMNFAIASGFAAAEAVKKAKQGGDFSKKSLAYYGTLLNRSFVLQDLKNFRRTPSFLAKSRLYELYPALACGVARRLFRVDGQPRKRLLALVKDEMRGKVSLSQAVKDG
ncbi:MAG: FAD-dependent oxidoreductase, partial [Chloroflexi bacterium]|nr:FAD-dependent oxidoreductase [Chloroflexota bacterium]